MFLSLRCASNSSSDFFVLLPEAEPLPVFLADESVAGSVGFVVVVRDVPDVAGLLDEPADGEVVVVEPVDADVSYFMLL